MKMIKTELRERNYGYAAYAECPICGADVRIGSYVHRDETPSEMPVNELVAICLKETDHNKAQAESHDKAVQAFVHGGITPEDYV